MTREEAYVCAMIVRDRLNEAGYTNRFVYTSRKTYLDDPNGGNDWYVSVTDVPSELSPLPPEGE